MSVCPEPTTVPAFKAAVGSFASGVTVVTTLDFHLRPVGMTATAFTSVSTDPLLVLICVNRSTRTFADIVRSGLFGVNLLSAGSDDVSAYCSTPGSDKALPAEWLVDVGNRWSAPAIGESVAFLDCEVYRHFPAGTHEIVIGRVCGIGLPPSDETLPEPLLHFRAAYRRLEPSLADAAN